jgi:hypothetical protein
MQRLTMRMPLLSLLSRQLAALRSPCSVPWQQQQQRRQQQQHNM